MKILFALLAFVSLGAAQIPTVSLPHVFATDSTPRIRYVYENDTILANRIIQIRDTVNGDSVKTLIKSLGSLRLTLDNDDNGTAHCLAVTHNGATDTIAKFCDDLSTKAFGALNITGRTTLTDSLIGVSQRLSGNLAAVNGAFSGTLGVTGVQTNSARTEWTTNASGGVGSIWKSSGSGLVLQGVTASSYDFSILNVAAQPLFRNPTGTQTVEFSGPVTHSSTLTQTGAATFASTIATTGLHTADGGILFASSNSGAQGKITKNSTTGLEIRGVAGSVNDVTISSADAGTIFANLTGTRNITVGHSSGTTTFPGAVTGQSTISSTVTGTHSFSGSTAGSTNTFSLAHTDNTNAASHARINLTAGGASGGDPYLSFLISGAATLRYGLDNTDSDALVWSTGASLGASNIMRLSMSGALSLPEAGGGLSVTGPLTQTGEATFTAPPVFSSVTASQFLLVDGSKALTSVAGTGSGSVVRATSPTLVTPALGAATATSIVASGNITADSIISPNFHSFGTFTGTLTGMTTSPTTTARWERVGQNVTICLDSASALSNATTFTVTGMPASLYPARNVSAGMGAFRNGTGNGEYLALIVVQSDGVIAFDIPDAAPGFELYWGDAEWNSGGGRKGIGGVGGVSGAVVQSVCFTYNRR